MNRITVRVIRSAVAGAILAMGIGLGAFNPWWAALVVGVPLVIAGVALIPRATRTSELPLFRRGVTKDAVPIEVSALTRSTLAAGDDQPTLVTAHITPRHDTAYDARWISAMSRAHFDAVAADPTTTLPPEQLPNRSGATPGFASSPGTRALLYPAVAATIGAAVLFGIPTAVWDVDAPIGSPGSLLRLGDETTLDQRRDRLLSAVAASGPAASTNILSLTFADGSDRAEIYDPGTGESVGLWVDGDTVRQSRSTTTLRSGSTFDATEVAATNMTAIADEMERRTEAFAGSVDFSDLRVARPRPDDGVLLTGTFENPEQITDDHVIEATPQGNVASYFEPGDFTHAFSVLRAALADAGIPTDGPVFTRWEIRGIADNTPIMYAGQIQNSGGALAEFATGTTDGQVSAVPGRFPELTTRPSDYRPPGFAMDDVTAATFDSVRRQAMVRGRVEPVDRNALDIQATTDFRSDGVPVILVAMGDSDGSEGTYTLRGEFLRAGYH
ncbi:hypothetical protein ABLE92_16870 [Gordonia sp. VNQ95]|uniref:hypothetical protein n=1 Tax=Gordonia TaxID=2053 RepID=UPI0032B4356B